MVKLLNKKIHFGSNDSLYLKGIITDIKYYKDITEITMSLYIHGVLDEGHYITLNKKQIHTLLINKEISYIADDNAHIYIKVLK